MMLDKQNEFIQHVMANRDATITDIAKSMTHTGTSEGTLVEREVNDSDFVRYSR
jgi:hypothetical protein